MPLVTVVLAWVPTVIFGIEEIPALDFGFLFFALAFSSIFFLWLKGTTPLWKNAYYFLKGYERNTLFITLKSLFLLLNVVIKHTSLCATFSKISKHCRNYIFFYIHLHFPNSSQLANLFVGGGRGRAHKICHCKMAFLLVQNAARPLSQMVQSSHSFKVVGCPL